MASVSTYLNFDGRTERAFAFYKSVFGTEYAGPIHRIGDLPAKPGETRTEAQRNRVMHMALPILGGHVLMGTDVPEVTVGDNVQIFVAPDTRAHAERLFAALAKDGKVMMPLEDRFWGAYFGQLVDAFGVQWLVNVDHAVEAAQS